MNITFKQGIIRYPTTGSSQSFLKKSGTTVDLLADNGSTLVTFAHGTSDYTYEELLTVSNAWIGPFSAGSEYWLYWDLDTLTGLRTFGYTELQPAISSTKPSAPLQGQHWYDLATNKMMVWETTVWRNVIRVFSAYYDGIDFASMGLGVGSFPFAGSQVGITNIQAVAGKLLFSDNGKPILKANKEFFTTESVFNVNGSNIDTLRLESSYEIVKANETLARYHVVHYIDDNIVEFADYSDANSILGMVTEDVIINGLTNVILNGVINNSSWNFADPIGALLWVSEAGELVNADPHLTDVINNPKQHPSIAKVISPTSILFQPTYQTEIDVIAKINPATTGELGVVKLTTDAIDGLHPIVVTDTDPRLTDERTALPHVHDALNTVFATDSGMTSINVRNALDELNDGKADIAGTTFTGSVLLSGTPTTNLEAANKKYVDDLVSGLSWIEPIQFVNVIGDTLGTPPATPLVSDTYIIPTLGSPSGDWLAFTNDDIVQWDGTQWNVIGNLTTLTVPTRFGIAMTTATTAFGTFITHEADIATYDSGVWTFETPVDNNAVLVNSELDVHAYHQFVYDTEWIEFAGPHTILAGVNLEQVQNTFNVKNVVDGGTIDALTLNGSSDTDFVAVSGDVMTGTLTLNADPALALEAATKQYVDSKASSLPELTDVDPALAPIDDDVLYYENASSLWKSKQIVTGGGGGGSPYTFSPLPYIATVNGTSFDSNNNGDILLSNQDLTASGTAATWDSVISTTGKSSGKHYVEYTILNTNGNNENIFGIAGLPVDFNNFIGSDLTSFSWYGKTGQTYHNGVLTQFGQSYTQSGIVLGMALDLDSNTVLFSRNAQAQIIKLIPIEILNTGSVFVGVSAKLNNGGTINFGDTPFSFPPPAGFIPWNGS